MQRVHRQFALYVQAKSENRNIAIKANKWTQFFRITTVL